MKVNILCIALLLLPLQVYSEEVGLSGKAIFEARCGDLCHQLPEPDMLDARQWKLVLATMQKRMAQTNIPSLTPQELEAVLQYLKGSAKN